MRKWLFLFFFICGTSLIAKETALKIKIAVGAFPESIQYKIAEKCKEYIEDESDISVEIFYGQHFGNETSALKELQKNKVQIAVVASGPCDDFATEMMVLDYPFLFDDYKNIDRLLYGPPGDKILLALERTGFKGLAFSDEGFRHLTNDVRAIHNVEDVRGLKIRVMESLFHKAILESFHANAIPIGWPIYHQLANHEIDGEDNPLSVIFNSRFYEVQKYLSLTHHMFSAVVCLANLDWFNKLSGPMQEIISSNVKKAALWGKIYNREMEKHMLKKLKNTDMIVDENPDITSFKREVKDMKDTIFFSDPNIKKLLEEFLEK
jgi:tripartite ATP-independent transporter DctP family solute receptor